MERDGASTNTALALQHTYQTNTLSPIADYPPVFVCSAYTREPPYLFSETCFPNFGDEIPPRAFAEGIIADVESSKGMMTTIWPSPYSIQPGNQIRP